jgi:hypothetical protein
MKNITLLDARNFKWTPFAVPGQSGYFDFLKPESPKMEAKGEVFFDHRSFQLMDFSRNGISLSYYGSGSVNEYAAMELTDGRILFCIVSGSKFTDTFHSADSISMQYWMLTPLS